MGEQNVELIEHNVKNNGEDIRELKKRVSHIESNVNDLKSDHQLTKQSITHVLATLSKLEKGFEKMDEKFDNNTQEQLKAYKSFMLKVSAGIIVTVIGGFLLMMSGLK